MSFRSGRVSFCRFHVVGDAPLTLDETALGILTENAFVEQEIGTPNEIESGFITGEHLLDTQFTFEKNAFGDPPGSMLLFALRVDTNKVPAEVRHAQRRINELAAASQNPSGFASKAQKREAKELADRAMAEDLAKGKYRKSKSIPLLWDLSNQTLYCAASGNKVAEQVAMRMRQAFEVTLEPMGSGGLASKLLIPQGKGRDMEDLRPSAITSPPAETGESREQKVKTPRGAEVPPVPWVSASSEPRDFLGNEFLLWLWWQCETSEGLFDVADIITEKKLELSIMLDRTLDMDCAWGQTGKQSLRGAGPTRMPEAAHALLTGKWPRKAGLMLADRDAQYELTLQGDRLIVSGSTLPEVADAESPRQLLEARLLLTRRLAQAIDSLYAAFLSLRVGSGWSAKRSALRRWIGQRAGQTHE